MNILPLIKTPGKRLNFSNPLSGVTYNNNNFLKQCDYFRKPEAVAGSQARKSSLANYRLTLPTSSKKQPATTKDTTEAKDEQTWGRKNHQRAHSSMMAQTSYVRQNEQLQRQQKQLFKFPDIQIKIIDEISTFEELADKKVRINLSHYFLMFFKKALAGPPTIKFIRIVQKYLTNLISKDSLDTPVEVKDFPSQLFNLRSKRAFIQRIQQFQSKSNLRPIEEMVKFYCVPTRQFRESCFRDILHMLKQSLYEKFNLNKDKQYFLLDRDGRVIEEICAIDFSTDLVLIALKSGYQKSYAQFRNIVQNNINKSSSISFSEGLKKRFRGEITKGKYDQSKPYFEDEINLAETRRRAAENTLLKKKTSQKSLQKFRPSRTTNNFNKSRSKSRQGGANRSKSTLAQIEPSTSPMASTKIRTMSARRRDRQYQAQFQKIRIQNSTFDITFNHNNDRRLLIAALKKQFSLFQTKTHKQVEAILSAFGISPDNTSISWQQFQKINQVASCKGNHQDIVQFVSSYLPFNQFGELDKENLQRTIKFVLEDVNNEGVVIEIIWNWLEKNHLIENGVLVRNTLSSWYERNKMAFVIMVSIIFGTNQTSWIDMAYEILV